MSEIYISVDVETDGPIPGANSMLSIGAAAFTVDRRMLGTFSMNVQQLPEAKPDDDTMKWWGTQPEAWAACRKDPQHPAFVIGSFILWVQKTCKQVCTLQDAQTQVQPVFVGYPAGFDFTWIYWYLIKFAGQSPFSFSALDIKTFAMSVLGCGYREVNKKSMAAFVQPGLPHTHVAVDDAIEQGYLFLNLLRLSRAHVTAEPDLNIPWPGDQESPHGGDE